MSRFVRTPRALDLGSLSILVIDDQPFFRVLLTEVLRGLGVGHVGVAIDGEDGFDAFNDMCPDIVITDWMMPKLDGIDLTRRIRSLTDDVQKQVPIILVTAKNERSQIDFARSSGVDEFILKPISAKSICDRLRQVIEKPRPFVTFGTYTGPCRRRRDEQNFVGPFRRFDDPFEIDSNDEAILAEGLRSVFVAAADRVSRLTKNLVKTNDNIRPIHMAVSEMEEIAEDMSDTHLERVCELLLTFIVAMNKTGKGAPSIIQTHMNAMDVLLRTPPSQTKMRDDVVSGLERVMQRPKAA